MNSQLPVAGVEEIVPTAVLQDLTDSLSRLAGVPVFFGTPDGRTLTKNGDARAICCRLTTGEPVDRPCIRCRRMTYGLDGSHWPEDPDIAARHRCPTGLADIVLPIRSQGRVVGLIGTPQVALGPEGEARARRILARAGTSDDVIEGFMDGVSVQHDAGRLDEVRTSIRAIAELVLSLGGDALAARRAADRLQTLAGTDALTGLANRREAEAELEAAMELAGRHGRPFGVLLFDIDHFKRVNDTCGHPEGDRVLVAFADLLSRSMRRTDRCFRYGGEEFLVVCHESDLRTLCKAADRIRSAVAHTAIRAGDLPPVTVSIGAAAFPECSVRDAADLIARADQALYEAKRAGRDRLCCAASN